MGHITFSGTWRCGLIAQHDVPIHRHGHRIRGWRCLLETLRNRLVVVGQQRTVIPFHATHTGHATAVAIHVRHQVGQDRGQILTLQGQELVAAPHNSNRVGLEHNDADEGDQHDNAQRLGAQLEQLVPPRQLLVLQQPVHLAQVGQEVGRRQSEVVVDGGICR